ncbi:Tn3 family transposase [Streptomyces sp. enrichment culture]|uniref:Tn3 family transposase n=1 Tax=Streptomyces sp. enrichment culture TaxID=1795815 RepID=UPI003F564E24
MFFNAVALWNTRCLDAAVPRLRAEGRGIKDEDVARLPPLKDRHINFLGRYLFHITASGPGRDLRPFRDSDAPEDDDEEE